jgi:alpha-glucosidase (family GH31 glycosyl hydrolase)
MTEVAPVTHRPLGSGHPYRIDPDQRHPVHPVAGEPLELRVLVSAGVAAVTVELAYGGETIALAPVDLDGLYPTATDADGHLAAASGARPDVGGLSIWRAVLPAAPNEPFRYRFVWRSDVAAGTTEWFAVRPGRWTSGGGELAFDGDVDRLIPESVEWLVTADGPVRARLALRLDPDEHVIGFGERFDAVDQRGRILDAVVFEQYKQQGARTYLPSPFAVVAGGEGWGFHVRTSRRTWFDVGHTATDRLAVEVATAPDEPRLEVRLYDGPPAAVLAAHLDEVGSPKLPPAWIFRPWMSGNEWNTQARVLAEVERSVELGIPVGVVVIEAWSDESTFTAFRDARYDVRPDGAPLSLADFEFPADGAWPDPAGMVARLHELGVKVLLWQIPLVTTDRGDDGQVAADAATMIERRYCVAEGAGAPYHNRGWWFPGALLPDWTNPDAVDWWLAKRRYLLTDVGVDGFKTDGGEHAWGDELRYADGSRGDRANNLYPLRYAEAYHRLLEDCGVDGVTFSRAGFTGAGRAPCHWAGDEDSTWEAFRASITAGLTAAASGVPFWGWDLAGFSGEIPSVELYLRATAMAALCPIMQYHSEFNHGRTPSNDRTPWNIAERHGDDRAIDLYRRFAVLRERLIPYLVAAAERTVASGMPLMRALCFDHPDDPTIWDAPTQYQLGDSVLVAPVCWEGLEELDIYLPAGSWVDAWTGSRHDGPAWVPRTVPWHEIPAYLRADRAQALRPAFVDLPGFSLGLTD